jgi:nitroreductase
MTGLNLSRVNALRSAAGRVQLAPSIHNSQPWRLVLHAGRLDLYADRSRQLAVLDPSGRQLYISLGCALLNARVALAALNVPVRVDYLPDAGQPDLAASLIVDADHGVTDPELAVLEPAIDRRQTNRRQFAEVPVPEHDVHELVRAAEVEEATLVPLTHEEDRQALARLSQEADTALVVDPRYRSELRAWTSDDPKRTDGVPAAAVPHVDGSSGDEVPIRDFDTRGVGWLPAHTGSTAQQCLLVLGTRADSRVAWLRAGEALQRVWLELTHRGYVASVFTQVVEVPALRARLREEIRLGIFPHLVLRVGHAPATPASMRRPLEEFLDDRSRDV